ERWRKNGWLKRSCEVPDFWARVLSQELQQQLASRGRRGWRYQAAIELGVDRKTAMKISRSNVRYLTEISSKRRYSSVGRLLLRPMPPSLKRPSYSPGSAPPQLGLFLFVGTLSILSLLEPTMLQPICRLLRIGWN